LDLLNRLQLLHHLFEQLEEREDTMFVSTLRLIVTALGTVNAAGVVHSIDVGNGGIKFAPNSLTAAVGDQ
jgi:hypothetical protein